MAEDSDLERTEPASSRRLEQAREEGRVPQSRELTAFLVLLAGVSGCWAFGSWLVQHASGILRRGLSFGRVEAFDGAAMNVAMAALSWEAVALLAPIFLLSIFGAVASPALLGGVVFSPKAMAPDLGRVDPFKGLARIFSMQGIAELVKALLKAALVGVVVCWVVMQQHDSILAMMAQPIETGLVSSLRLILFAAMALVGGVALVAAIDVPFQLWQYHSKMRMTKEEVRQEGKEQEGDPHVKARIRSQQREMARRRMMEEVPKADVVVTNPTHYAVALMYDGKKMGAPQVVAKGADLVAQKIRELAAENGVPLLEAPPLARALYRYADVGDQIPSALYTAVAEVMAYVYQLNQFLANEVPGMLAPQMPCDFVVPAGMDPDAPADAEVAVVV